jgi:hypothetical protein
MSMFGDMHPRTGAGHYYVNGGLTETSERGRKIEAEAIGFSQHLFWMNTLNGVELI